MLTDQRLASLSPEMLHQGDGTNGNRDPKPYIGQNSKSVREEWEMELTKPECSWPPQEDPYLQLTSAHGGSQRNNHQLNTMLMMDPALFMFVADVQLGRHVGPEQLELGLSLTLMPDIRSPSSPWTA